MKAKLLALCLILSGLTQGATLVQTLSNPDINTSVYLDGSIYTYEYVMSSKPIDDRHELSHVTVSLCNSENIFGAFANGQFTPETTQLTYKFDNLNPQGETFVFGFQSFKSPELSTVLAKAATETETYQILAPTCAPSVPEPSAALLGGLGILALLRRRR